MKRLCAVCAALLALLLLTACGQKQGETSTDITATATTTEAAETTTPAPSTLTVFADGQSEYALIRSAESDGIEQHLYFQFYLQMEQRSGAKLKYAEDLIAFNTKPDPTKKELLLGHTNREESATLAQQLEAAGGNRFGILVSEHKVAVMGTDAYQCFYGLDYLMEQFIRTDESGQPVMELTCGYSYISEERADAQQSFDIKQLCESGQGIAFAMMERVIRVPSSEGCTVLQGGGSDGTYLYYALINKSTTPETAVIHKYDPKTWGLVKSSGVLPTGHTNDITYDKKHDRLVISSGTDSWRGTHFLDPDTLEIVDYIVAPISHRGIEYLPSTNQYIIGTGYTIYLTDEALNPIRSFPCRDPQYVTQGLYCDEKYVYDVRYNSGSTPHYIIVHDIDGNYMGSAKLSGVTTEPENLTMYNGEYYLACNQSNSVYHIVLIPENWW